MAYNDVDRGSLYAECYDVDMIISGDSMKIIYVDIERTISDSSL